MSIKNIANGIYRIHWKSGGESLAAVGVTREGGRWLAPINWVAPTTNSAWEGEVERFERLSTISTERRIRITHNGDGIEAVETDGEARVLIHDSRTGDTKVFDASVDDDEEGDFITVFDEMYDELTGDDNG